MYKSINLEKIKPRAICLPNDKKIPRLPSDVKEKERTPSPSLYKPDFNKSSQKSLSPRQPIKKDKKKFYMDNFLAEKKR